MKVDKSDERVDALVGRITKGEIDLQPDFQRGEIWDPSRKQRLVDTILRGWFIPAIHIVVDTAGDEIVLDGQQRLAAVRDFLSDDIAVDGSIAPSNESILGLDGLVFSKLPHATQKAVNRFVIQVITLSDYQPQEPNELFFRLNQSYNLTPPEKRNALHGTARDQVKGLVSELTSIGLLSPEAIGFSNGRLAYDDIVARVCVALQLGTLRKHINNKVVEDFYRNEEFPDPLIASVLDAADRLYQQVALQDRVKLNKGTLQTWLIYCAWAPESTGQLPSTLLHDFERDRLEVRRTGELADNRRPMSIQDIVRIYDDRASYRVTDVSSVLARDLAIHLYSQSVYGTAPIRGSDRLIAQSDGLPQANFFDFLDISQWGDPLGSS